jgi:hypothetical protein
MHPRRLQMKLKRIVQNAVRFVQDVRVLRANQQPGQQIVLVSWLPVRHREWVTICHPAGSTRLVRLFPSGRGVHGELKGYNISDSYTFPALTPCLTTDVFARHLRMVRQDILDYRMLWSNREPGERLTTVGRAHGNSRAERIRMIGLDRTTRKPQVRILRDLRPSPRGGFIHRYLGETSDNYGSGVEPCLIRFRESN